MQIFELATQAVMVLSIVSMAYVVVLVGVGIYSVVVDTVRRRRRR